MSWKTFLKMSLLIILSGIVFYLVCPKYYFIKYENSTFDVVNKASIIKCNKINGKAETTLTLNVSHIPTTFNFAPIQQHTTDYQGGRLYKEAIKNKRK